MAWSISLVAFAIIFLFCAAISFFRKMNSEELARPIEGYLLANNQLKRHAVINLLLSTSFGLNSLFFQIWLGYLVGVWALVIQSAWAVGFMLLSPFAAQIRATGSLHEELGIHFRNTRRTAAIFSLLGIMFMMCWETRIGVAVFTNLFNEFPQSPLQSAYLAPNLLIWAIVIGTLFYTVLGGIRGNAKADVFLNFIKTVLTLIIVVFIFKGFTLDNYALVKQKFFPSFSEMISNLGIFGLITSVIFSLSWQFVDNSTWQSLISGQGTKPLSGTLNWSGIIAFVAPGIIGTLLGVSLALVKDVQPENSFGSLLSLVHQHKLLALLFVFAISISCLMSMLDGLFLTAAYTIFVDIINPSRSLREIEQESSDTETDLLKIRVLLIATAILAVGGLGWLMNVLKIDIFSYVYFVVISQLALFGPVIVSLATERVPKRTMSLVIVTSATIGFVLAISGSIWSIAFLQEGAGTFTTLLSLVLAFANSTPKDIKTYASV